MTDPIATFCDYYHGYHDISEQRRRMQLRVLRHFESHLQGAVLELDSDQFQQYLSSLVAAGLHPNTVRQYRNAIRPFLTWLWQRKLINADSLLELRAVAAPRGATRSDAPNPYNGSDLQRFWPELEATYPYCRDGGLERAQLFVKRWRAGRTPWRRVEPYAKRLQIEAIVALALSGGLRRDEIFNLNLKDMHYDNEYIVVAGARKNPQGTSRARVIPWVSDDMRAALKAWIEFRVLLDPPHDRPWLSLYQEAHYLKPMRHRRFEMLLHDLGSGWEFHRMRHTAATLMLRSGMPLEQVQKILGHARIQQTLAYADITAHDIIVAASRSRASFERSLRRRAA